MAGMTYEKWITLSKEEQDRITAENAEKIRWCAKHQRDAKERSAICRKIADEIKPLLQQHGFVKVRQHFLRVHGDHLLQIISVLYPGRTQPRIEALVFPLYAVLEFRNLLLNLREAEGIGGYSLEVIAGIDIYDPEEDTFLAYQTDFEEPIEKEKQLLTDCVLPFLDKITTNHEYLQSWFSFGETAWPDAGAWLKEGDFEKAENAINRYYQSYLPLYEELKDSPYPFFQEQVLPAIQQSENLLKATCERDQKAICRYFNKSMTQHYRNIEKFSKTFAKVFPIEYFAIE